MIKSANSHINERETRRLYQDPYGDRWTHHRWSSFNDQLDQFYDQCLQNKFGPFNVHYFLAQRLTVKESTAFEKKFQYQEDARYIKRHKKAEKHYQKKLHEFEKKARKHKWTKAICEKRRKENAEITRASFKKTEYQIQQNKNHTSKYPEFLDHQLFHGSRITIDWNFTKEDRGKIKDEMQRLMQDIWPYKSPYEKHLDLMKISKETKSQVRRIMINDINQQLRSRTKT